MNIRLSNQLNMVGACLAIAQQPENKAVWDGKAPLDFTADLAALPSAYDAALAKAALADAAIGGAADTRAAAEAALEDAAHLVARALAAHYRKAGALDRLARVDLSRTDIVRCAIRNCWRRPRSCATSPPRRRRNPVPQGARADSRVERRYRGVRRRDERAARADRESRHATQGTRDGRGCLARARGRGRRPRAAIRRHARRPALCRSLEPRAHHRRLRRARRQRRRREGERRHATCGNDRTGQMTAPRAAPAAKKTLGR